MINKKTLESFDGDTNRAWILQDRYLLPGEFTIKDIAKRFKKELPPSLHKDIDEYIPSFDFIPGGRILRSLGAYDDLSLFNCLCIPSPLDTLVGKDGIIDRLNDLAISLKKGAGVGIDFSTLRPEGAKLYSCFGHASGPTSFMQLFSDLVAVIMQGGTRRGALLLSLKDYHKDILDFIALKNNNQEAVKYANLSVRIVQDEMNESIINSIVSNAWATGEPGIIFEKNIKEDFAPAFLGDKFKFEGVNACSEIPLPAWGVCCLGAINLSNMCDDSGIFDYFKLYQVVKFGINFLNSIIDYAYKRGKFPLDKCIDVSMQTRQIGLGIMGLSHLLFKKDLAYGSDESIEYIDNIIAVIKEYAWHASAELGGSSEISSIYDKISSKDNKEKWIQHVNKYAKFLDNDEKRSIVNSTILSGQPTGTTSLLANTTNGIEPLYSLNYYRSDLNGTVQDHVYNRLKKERNPNTFVVAYEIPWINRIKVQSTLQSHIDSAISSTINLHESVSIEQVKQLFNYAYEAKLKSLTIFRDKCNRIPIYKDNCKSNSCEL